MTRQEYAAPAAGLNVCAACSTRFAALGDHDTEACTGVREDFDRILDLEAAVRLSGAAALSLKAGVTDYRAGQNAAGNAADRARLSAALDALTLEQMRAFGQYRAAALV